jgi:hypothetical protein
MNYLKYILFFLMSMSSALVSNAQTRVASPDVQLPAFSGGELDQAQLRADAECRNLSPLFLQAQLISDKFNVWGRVREFGCIFAKDDELNRPSSIQQKVIQTRQYGKNIVDVVAGLKQFAADDGWIEGNGILFARLNPAAIAQAANLNDLSGSLTKVFGSGPYSRELRINFEVKAVNKTTTDIRIRSFVKYINKSDAKDVEIFSNHIYSTLFEKISKQLFIEGLSITPTPAN